MLTPLLLAAGLVPQAQSPAPASTSAAQEPQRLVEVHLSEDRIQDLLALDLDIPHVHGEASHCQVIADQADLEALERGGFDFHVLVDDLQGFYAERLAAGQTQLSAGTTYGANLTPPFGQGGMGGYYTFIQVESVLDQLFAQHGAIMTQKQSLGTSIQGRHLWMVKVSDNPGVDEPEPEARFDSLHHAREPQGMQANLWFLLYLLEEYGSDPLATYLVNERELFFVLVVNPDGYVYNQQIAPGGGGLWRKNRRNNGGGSTGVDLNRNYPFQWGFDSVGSSGNPDSETYRGSSPASEPETQAMTTFIQARSFKTALSIHTYSNLWISPWGYDELYPSNYSDFEEIGELATEENGYVHAPGWVTLYEANGVTNDYDFGTKGTLSWTPEIGSSQDGFWPPQSRIVPLAEENLLAMQRTALAAGPWLRAEAIDVTASGDGDAYVEPGEDAILSVGLRNSGLAPTGAVSGSLSTTSPFVTGGNFTASASALGNFSSGQLSPALTASISPSTPFGTVIELTLTLTEGGRSLDVPVSFEVGEPVVVASYDFEAGGNQGWSVGAPNDANTGTWTRGNPIGTAAQPEDDHTPDPADTCWFTGQGSQGGSLGENDVDGGTTTLLSPVLDVSGVSSPRLRYWRWYSNNTGGNPNDDVFQVDLSADGGSSWTSAEVVGPTGAGTSGGWFEVDLLIEDFVPATSQFRARFRASDLGGGSIVEAALDDVDVFGIPDGCPPPQSYCTTSPNSAGPGALIAAGGSQAVSDNAFALTATGSIPNEFGIFYYGPSQDLATVGNGFRCVGGSLYRLPAIQGDGAGVASLPVDFTTPPAPAGQILPGSTWNFQWWYRNPGVGAGFNFSDAVSVTFCN